VAAVPPVPSFAPGIMPTSLISAITSALNFLMTRPNAEIRQAVAQSIPNATFTALTFDTKDLDSALGWSSGSNTRYTAQYAGVYAFSGACSFTSNATGIRGVAWSLNGTLLNQSGTFFTAVSGNTTGVPAPTLSVFMNVGDFMELKAFQNSGGAVLTVVATNNQPFLSVWQVSIA
jgi:hypothetical protein